MKILAYTGRHDIHIYANSRFDKSVRKYKGGEIIATIPYSGRMLNAKMEEPEKVQMFQVDHVLIPVSGPVHYESIDPIPEKEECDYAVVSVQYLNACKQSGMDTSRLLTIGPSVIDDHGKIIGTIRLQRN